MATKTRRQLKDAALENLGQLASGQTAEAEDLARIDPFVDTTIADLRDREVIYIACADEIDDAIFDDLALCVANAARHAFGEGGNAELPAAVKGVVGAETNLRTKSAEGPTYQTLETTYY